MNPYAARRNALLRRVPAITYPTPTITGVSPAMLDAAGNQSITIFGTGFMVPSGAASGDGTVPMLSTVKDAHVGGHFVTGITVVSETELTCTTTAFDEGGILCVRTFGGDAVFQFVSTHFTGQLGIARSFPANLELGVP